MIDRADRDVDRSTPPPSTGPRIGSDTGRPAAGAAWADRRAVESRAEQVHCELEEQERAWARGFTRRRMIKGIGMAGVAALGAQLVTTRVSFASAAGTGNTVIVVFLRGGADGLRMLVPKTEALGGPSI